MVERPFLHWPFFAVDGRGLVLSTGSADYGSVGLQIQTCRF